MKSSKVSALALTILLSTFTQSALANPTMDEFLNSLNPKTKAQAQAKKERIENLSELDEYIKNPLANYITKEDYEDLKRERESRLVEGRVITINTADKEGCRELRTQLNLEAEVCKYDAKSPLVSLIVMRNVDDKGILERKFSYSQLSDKTKVAMSALGDFALLGGAAFGIIYALPESVSKWDKSRGFGALAGQWKDRVKDGPVIDNDDWAINYIGHPVSGAYYYTLVRHQGFSKWESAAFSFCMSTFFWEYGIEAFAEKPSVQDLILTPLLGSIMGELFYVWDKSIEKNNGELLGSRRLGKTATLLMNPAGAFSKKINKLTKSNLIKDINLKITTKKPEFNYYMPNSDFLNSNEPKSDYLGLSLNIVF